MKPRKKCNFLPPAVRAEEGVRPGAELCAVLAPPAGAGEVPESLQLRPPVGETEVMVWGQESLVEPFPIQLNRKL